jgi:hypothetical protein
MNSRARRDSGSGDPVKEATIVALKRVLDPLLDLMFDAGVTVQEFNKITRDRAVRIAMRRVVRDSGRQSKSRVAIITGLPRSEVTRILNSLDSAVRARPDHHPARRVLAAWHDNPRFLAPSGEPAILPIFGRRRSFEQLVEKYGAGIPVRAMLDELIQLDAVEQVEDQRLKAKTRVPVSTGLSSRSIAAVGERGRDLLETLAHNVRKRSQPLFEATALIQEGDLDMVTLIRREITEQGTNFINGATALFNRSQRRRNSKAAQSATTCRFGVTLYYFQDELTNNIDPTDVEMHGRRKNLRRQKRKPKKLDFSQLSE